MRIKIKALRRLIRESATDINKAAAEYRAALRQVPAPQQWMRYRGVKIHPPWNGKTEVAGLHGFIPRRFRHEDEDYGSDNDSAWQEYDAWENATGDVIERFSKLYPEIQFGTERGQ
jgi:hypothetical protein